MLQIQPSNQWLSDYLGVCYNNLYSFNSQELSMLGIALVRLKQQPSHQWLAGYLRAVQLQLEATVAVGDTAITSHSSVANSITNHSSNISSSSSSHASESSVSRDQQEPEQAQQPQQEQDQAAASSDSSGEPSGFQPQGLVNVLWVLAVWRVQPDTAWQGSCLAAIQHSAGHCSIQGISTLLWALTRLQVRRIAYYTIDRRVLLYSMSGPVGFALCFLAGYPSSGHSFQTTTPRPPSQLCRLFSEACHCCPFVADTCQHPSVRAAPAACTTSPALSYGNRPRSVAVELRHAWPEVCIQQQ